MNNPKNIIKAFDALKDEEGRIDINKLTDEEIDKIIDLQWEMIEQLDALSIYKKMKADIRLKAQKQEKEAEILIRRLMQRLDLQEHDNEYCKIKTKVSYKYEIDETKLPKDLYSPNHAKITAMVNKWEDIEGVQPWQWYLQVSIR